jgi:UDP-N-acetylglucosamine diphosphorylase/glucosamine-1-phosphate N-acetyltransferase
VIIFEDQHFRDLYPLTLTRPVFDLRCGILTLAGKAERVLGGIAGYHVRDYLAPVVDGAVTSYGRLLEGGDLALLVNGRALMTPDLAEAVHRGRRGAYMSGGTVVAAVVGKEDAAALDGAVGSALDGKVFDGLPAREVDADLVRYPWDIIKMNGEEIESDVRLLGLAGIATNVPDGVWLVNEPSISLAGGVSIAPGVVLDASEGPIHIAAGATVMANSSLMGPLYVGEGSTIKMGSKIYGETSIGPVCKIGGELAESVVHGYANKQHDGFLGHSYLGEWVNLGAGTETSDLKNNYSTVKVRLEDGVLDTGELFVGLFMGDHSKCGIGTVFNTGTVVGACCNLFGAGYPPKFIPSFTWGGGAGFEEYDPARALETVGRAMRRRGIEPGPGVEAVLKRVYEITGDSREAFMKGA